MPPTPPSRARLRQSEMLRAHTDSASRHPHSLGAAAAVLLSAALVLTTATSAAAAVEEHSGAITELSQPASVEESPGELGALSVALPMQRITDEADAALAAAQSALGAAQQLHADVEAAGLDLGTDSTTVDTTTLEADAEALTTADRQGVLTLVPVTAKTVADTAPVVAATEEIRTALVAAQEKKAAEEKAAAELAQANTVGGAKSFARSLASNEYGWGSGQFSCLESLWTKESGWNYRAYNPSGATGIPQALPGDKMATAGSNWKGDARVQIAWGLSYIERGYGSPCAAWSHSQAVNWY